MVQWESVGESSDLQFKIFQKLPSLCTSNSAFAKGGVRGLEAQLGWLISSKQNTPSHGSRHRTPPSQGESYEVNLPPSLQSSEGKYPLFPPAPFDSPSLHGCS